MPTRLRTVLADDPMSSAMSGNRLCRRRNEEGAVLILALVFLITIGGVIGGLANWVTNDLNNTSVFTSSREMQYAATNATNVAVQSMRYTAPAQPPAVLPPTCWGGASTSQLATIEVGVTLNMATWCSTVWNATSAATRVVTISTCLVTPTETQATCTANPYLKAIVTFDDYPPGVSAPNPNPCVVYCGTGMTINRWDFQS
jgi:hypothetical protein